MDSNVKQLLTGSTSCKLDNEKDLSSDNPSTYTATISGAKSIYNLFPGRVLFLGYYKGMGTITIAVSDHELIRYLNMQDIRINVFQEVDTKTFLGTVYSQKKLQIEYCTQWKGDSIYPVHVNTDLYYKQNPIDILNGKYIPQKEITIQDGITRPDVKVKFTQNELLEWS